MKKLLIIVVIWGLILGGGAAAYFYLFPNKPGDDGDHPTTTVSGKVVLSEKGKLTATVDGKDKTYAIPDGAAVQIDGKDARVEDIKKDSDVTLTLKGETVTKVEAKAHETGGPKLRLALDSFSGYCIFRSPEFKKKLADQKLDFEWVDDKADYPARMKTVQAGETPLAVFTIDALLNTTPREGDPPATIILVIDETQGADAMLGLDPGMTDVDALNRKDAKLVLVENSPSETLSRVVRSQFKLPNLPLLKSEYLIPAKDADINDVYEKFLKAEPTEHKAFVLWEPYVSLALKKKGARVLVDSSKFKGYIVDVLVAQTDWLAKHPADAQKVVRTYLEELHRLQQTKGAMADLLLKDAHLVGENKVGPDEAAKMVEEIWWKNTMENYAHMGVLPPAQANGLQVVGEMIQNITTVLDQTKQPGEPSAGVARPDKLFDDSVLRALYNQRPSFMIGQETIRVPSAVVQLTPEQWNALQPVGLFQTQPIQFKKTGGGLAYSDFPGEDDVPTRIAKVAEKMRQWPQYYLRIEGHIAGPNTVANQQKAEQRANIVRDALIQALGADQANRIQAVGIESDPANPRNDVDLVMLQVPKNPQ